MQVPRNLFPIDVGKAKQFLRKAGQAAAAPAAAKEATAKEREVIVSQSIVLLQALRHRIGRTVNSNRGRLVVLAVFSHSLVHWRSARRRLFECHVGSVPALAALARIHLLSFSPCVGAVCVVGHEIGRKRALEAFISADLLDCTQSIGPRGQLVALLLTDQSQNEKKHRAGNLNAASHVLGNRSVSLVVLRRFFVEALRFVNRITSFERGRRYLLRHPEVIKLLVRCECFSFGVVATLIDRRVTANLFWFLGADFFLFARA